MRGSAGTKEVGEHCTALVSEYAFDDFYAMVEGGMIHDGENRATGSGLGVAGGEDEACDARVQNGSRAHGTGLQRAVERAAALRRQEAVVGECEAGGAEGDDLGVGCGIVGAENVVVAASDDLASG